MIPCDIPLSQLSAIMPGPPTDADRAGKLKVLRQCLNIAKSEEDLDVLKNHFPVIWVTVHNVHQEISSPGFQG